MPRLPHPPPKTRSLDPRTVRARVLDVLLRTARPGMKPGILNRSAQQVAAAIMRWPLTSKDPVHFGGLGMAHLLGNLGDPLSTEAILTVSRYVLHGRVMPVQRLVEVIDQASAGYLARCPCRGSGRVRDLQAGRRKPEARVDVALFAEPLSHPQVRRDTAPRLVEAILHASREGGSFAEVEDATWPYWEVLLEHPGYDHSWIEGLSANHKVMPVAKPVLQAWVQALYAARAVVFTHVEAAGLPYAVCCCPGPEADGGCLVTQWYYFSGNDEILTLNQGDKFGQRRDASGEVLPCRRYQERAGRPCLGCGCEHGEPGDDLSRPPAGAATPDHTA